MKSGAGGLVVVWVRDCEKKNISIAGRAGPEDFGARDKGLELGPLKNSTNYIYIFLPISQIYPK